MSDNGEDRESNAEQANQTTDETIFDDGETEATLNGGEPTATQNHSGIRLALTFISVTVMVLAGLVAWMGYHAHESHQRQQDRALVVQVGRQAAVNLTTISYADADTDVQRILDSAAGTFYEDFKKRAPAFVDVVKQAKSKSQGTVTEAGLESQRGGTGRVLVAVSVSSSTAGTPAQPRSWRMRIDVERIGTAAKVVKVEFVP